MAAYISSRLPKPVFLSSVGRSSSPVTAATENAPPAWAAVVDFRSAERQLEQYCAWLRRFSKCFGAECIDFRADFFDPNGRLKRELLLDGLHPTPEGHQIMARQLSAHLKKDNGN